MHSFVSPSPSAMPSGALTTGEIGDALARWFTGHCPCGGPVDASGEQPQHTRSVWDNQPRCDGKTKTPCTIASGSAFLLCRGSLRIYCRWIASPEVTVYESRSLTPEVSGHFARCFGWQHHAFGQKPRRGALITSAGRNPVQRARHHHPSHEEATEVGEGVMGH